MFWNFRQSYISVCQRPDRIPPQDSVDYDFEPRGLPPPPMPPELFIHYLEHDEGDLSLHRNRWISRLPKRRTKHVEDCHAYGVHVIEGPNTFGIFITTIVILTCTIVVSVAWSTANQDVQGGTGIGALVVTCYTAFLTAWIFWRNGS